MSSHVGGSHRASYIKSTHHLSMVECEGAGHELQKSSCQARKHHSNKPVGIQSWQLTTTWLHPQLTKHIPLIASLCTSVVGRLLWLGSMKLEEPPSLGPWPLAAASFLHQYAHR